MSDSKWRELQVPERLHRRVEALATILNMGPGVLTAEVMEAYLDKMQARLKRQRKLEEEANHDTPA